LTHLVKTDKGNGLHLYNDHKNKGEDSRQDEGGGGGRVRRQKRKGWEGGGLNGGEAGEITVNIIFAIKKRSKGRKPR